ncbi:hypothetical protein GT347_26750 [Xylophilus rhododendri]|uniref:Uncharacterized protein n=1 Tax=Xylophilus rhododendri TaxID=2697032 RepID=A0A857JDJ3_9BURK|nr:hypothetical protein [Xylophilus rhododendri]QHJ01272.1 hypothetical protein GT347_26750 [Xylophilus rhododendri]
MTSKKTPTIQQLLDERIDPINTQPVLRTIWNTSCGGYPAGELISISAGSGKSTPAAAKKTAKARAKA